MLRKVSLLLAALALVVVLAEDLLAQHITPIPQRSPGIMRTPRAPGSPPARGMGMRPLNKPHSDVYRRPTVSPYLNLMADDRDPTLPHYQTLVRPLVEQEQAQRTQQLQFQRLERQFDQFQQQIAVPPAGAPDLRPTGHPVRFMNLSHFYPSR